jgi:HAE1 family hydrophobic/amphiphilic exporter-1
MIVAYRNGNPVRLDEVAHVYDGVENDKTRAGSTAKRAIYLAIQKQPGTNVVAGRRRGQGAAADVPRAAAGGGDARRPHDRSVSIRESVHDVKFTLLLTSARRPGDLPVPAQRLGDDHPEPGAAGSIVGTFAVMYLLGYSLDNLSLMALTLSVGFVVDDAIVMLENIVRHMEMGKPPMQAALDGSKEIAFTIVSMTLSLAAVFIPVLFMGGIVGRLLHEFAVTIASRSWCLGLRVDQPDADAVQPLPEAAARAAHGGSTTRPSACSTRLAARSTTGRCAQTCASAP